MNHEVLVRDMGLCRNNVGSGMPGGGGDTDRQPLVVLDEEPNYSDTPLLEDQHQPMEEPATEVV